MQLSTSFLFTTLCALALVSSQNLSQETDTQLVAQFPSCVVRTPPSPCPAPSISPESNITRTQLACDKAAIAAVGCAETDYACHCAHTSPLQSIIVPCLLNSSNCTPADLTSASPSSSPFSHQFPTIENRPRKIYGRMLI